MMKVACNRDVWLDESSME